MSLIHTGYGVGLGDSEGRGFDSRPFHFQVTTLGKLFTHACLCHQAV